MLFEGVNIDRKDQSSLLSFFGETQNQKKSRQQKIQWNRPDRSNHFKESFTLVNPASHKGRNEQTLCPRPHG